MCKCAEQITAKVQSFDPNMRSQSLPDEPMVRIEYQGGGTARTQVYGAATRQFYGRRTKGEKFLVFEVDVEAQPGLFKAI